jgi:hypothetical protein
MDHLMTDQSIPCRWNILTSGMGALFGDVRLAPVRVTDLSLRHDWWMMTQQTVTVLFERQPVKSGKTQSEKNTMDDDEREDGEAAAADPIR